MFFLLSYKTNQENIKYIVLSYKTHPQKKLKKKQKKPLT
jgi:hypothetical protein